MDGQINVATAVGAAVVTTAAPVALNDVTTPFLGVPMTAVGMALGGALASFAYGRGLPSRGRLFFLAVANTFLASIAVAIFPPMFGWDWMKPEFAPPLAGFIAFGLRFMVPAFVSVAPAWIMARAGGSYQPPMDYPPNNTSHNGDRF